MQQDVIDFIGRLFQRLEYTKIFNDFFNEIKVNQKYFDDGGGLQNKILYYQVSITAISGTYNLQDFLNTNNVIKKPVIETSLKYLLISVQKTILKYILTNSENIIIKGIKFKLLGICIRSEYSPSSGHYVYCEFDSGNNTKIFNDDKIQDEGQYNRNMGYLYLYERIV
jgi:hypothetical protein